MPFRSFEFGDSIINTKSMPTAQSPRWYQLKTALFIVGTSHAATFSFFLFFLCMANLFHGSGGLCITVHLCHTPAPGRDFLGWSGNFLLSSLAAQFLSLWVSLSPGQLWAMRFGYNTSSCHHTGTGSIAWTAHSRKSMVSPSRCSGGSGLPPWIIWQIS